MLLDILDFSDSSADTIPVGTAIIPYPKIILTDTEGKIVSPNDLDDGVEVKRVSIINHSIDDQVKMKEQLDRYFSSEGDEDFTIHDWKGNNVLLFGSEGHGLKEKTSKYIDYPVKIKINDKIESLNIANSASVVFFHINKAKKILISD